MKVPRLRRRAAMAGVSLVVAAIAVVAAGTPANAAGHDNGRHVLPGTKPSWTGAVAQTAAVPASQTVRAKVWLAPRDADQLDALAKAVSDPSSSSYRQFISQAEYQARFAPTAAQVAQVEQWLTQSGLQVDAVGADNHYLAVSGSAAAIEAAFGTQLGQFAVNGKQVQAPATDVSVPDSVAGVVSAVTGLSKLGHMVKPVDFGAPDAFVNGKPCSDYYGQNIAKGLPEFNGSHLPFAVCGYVPSQLRGAYGVDATGSHGAGQTVAITDAYDATTLRKDANKYSVRHGDSPFADGQFRDKSVPEDPSTEGDCGGNGWYGEQALDIEAVHGMAPAANVHFYGAASCFDDDLLAQLAAVVHNNKASIVTNSWGEPTFVVIDGTVYETIDQGLIDAYESVFIQGAVQGIGFYFSSGDNGDELDAWGYKHPDWPAGDPWVTAVGGTSIGIGQDNQRLFETGWGTQKYTLSQSGKSWKLLLPFQYGAGGGFSQIFAEPWYQFGVVPGTDTGRAVPDIGMDADPTTGMLIGETQNFSLPSRYGPAGVHYGEYRIGGTSLASPLFAGVQADVQSGDRRIGFANPVIYFLAGKSGPYYDVTPQGDAGNVRADFANGQNPDDGLVYSVRTFDHDSSLTTGAGWDDVSGVGAPTPDYVASVG